MKTLIHTIINNQELPAQFELVNSKDNRAAIKYNPNIDHQDLHLFLNDLLLNNLSYVLYLNQYIAIEDFNA